MKRDGKSCKAAFERLLNSVHETHIVFENLSNSNRDMLQKAWGLNIGEGGRIDDQRFMCMRSGKATLRIEVS